MAAWRLPPKNLCDLATPCSLSMFKSGWWNLMPTEIRGSVLPRIETLLSRARASGMPVIYIQHDGSKGHRWRPVQKAGRFIRQ